VPATQVSFPSGRISNIGVTPPTLIGYFNKPDGPGPFPAVVLMHGCSGILGNEAVWRSWLRERGYASLSVDGFRPRGFASICAALGVVSQGERVADAFGALEYLASRGDIDASRVAVMGFSNGGVAVLGVAMPDPMITRKPGAPQFHAVVAFYPECKVRLGAAAPALAAPLLVLIGSKDDWTLASSCQEMAAQYGARATPVDLQVLPGALHGFDDPRAGTLYLGDAMNVNSPSGRGATVGGDPESTKRAAQIVEAFLSAKLSK
jgi:dienelactone hydrolase